MKFSQFPKEIKDKVKQRVEEQDRVFSEEDFNQEIIASNKTYKKGFHWKHTAEGHEFWHKVLEREDFDLFFERYPKNKTHYYTQIPTNVTVGDEFVISYKTHWDGSEQGLEEAGIRMGDLVTLLRLDNDDMPQFQLPDGRTYYIYWGIVKPVIEKVNMKNHYYKGNPKTKPKLGSKYRIITDKTRGGGTSAKFADGDYRVGDTVTLTHNDGSSCPYFRIDRTAVVHPLYWEFLEPITSETRATEVSAFTSIPTDVKLGDQFIVLQREGFDGVREPNTTLVGEIVELVRNNGSERPKFRYLSTNEEHWLNWGCLGPISNVTNSNLNNEKSNISNNNSSIDLRTTSESISTGDRSSGIGLPGRRRIATTTGGCTGYPQTDRRTRPKVEQGQIRTSI